MTLRLMYRDFIQNLLYGSKLLLDDFDCASDIVTIFIDEEDVVFQVIKSESSMLISKNIPIRRARKLSFQEFCILIEKMKLNA